MREQYTAQKLLEEYLTERRALGFSGKTDEGCIRRFLRAFEEPTNGKPVFTKEYVLQHTQRKLNQKTNTRLRDVSAINGFLDFAARKGFQVYRIPMKSLPKENRDFVARIFTDEEIERILAAADAFPTSKQAPDRHLQAPVMFRILFNCGLRTAELLRLKMCDVDLEENVFRILDTKFHKSRLVPFSDAVADALRAYLDQVKPRHAEDLIFRSPKTGDRFGASAMHTFFDDALRGAGIPRGGKGKGPRPHDIRHTFAVHCLNNWALNGVDLTTALPVLSRYLGHQGIHGTQKYLQLTAQMYPDIVSKLETKFGVLIPQMEASHETD
jgi:integrase